MGGQHGKLELHPQPGLAEGVHTHGSPTQTDLAGATGTATLSFTLDKTAPAVGIALVSDRGNWMG